MAVHIINREIDFIKSCILILILFVNISQGWIHNLKLQNDDRKRIMLTRTFGFLQDGTVAVNVTMFSYKPFEKEMKGITNSTFGFTLNKSRSPGLATYVETTPTCMLNKSDEAVPSVFLRFDLKDQKLIVERFGKDLHDLIITAADRDSYLYDNGLEHGIAPKEGAELTKSTGENKVTSKPPHEKSETEKPPHEKSETPHEKSETEKEGKKESIKPKEVKTEQQTSEEANLENAKPTAKKKTSAKPEEKKKSSVKPTPAPSRQRRETAEKKENDKEVVSKLPQVAEAPGNPSKASTIYLPLIRDTEGSVTAYKAYFLVHFKNKKEEGLYNMFFHNCWKDHSLVNLTLQIIQDNNGNYLSADEMPIPALYFMFSIVFFILSAIWFSVLRKAEEGVFKIHYMMLVVVLFKAISCLFHGVNMHMIQLSGIHVDAWAILWYIVYLMRGALMFVTVLLIGAGWAFIKHVFTDREKKLFLVIIPMQILMNVAWVIVEESEQGDASYNTWNKIFIGVDLLCCFAILFPVVWSIRHLQEASKTDGKAAINLNKLKLFRHFYILVVAYIYFTRIIGYLLKITLPFRYGWMTDLFREIFLLIFFVSTGYKFRPTTDNPYLQVPLDSDDEEEIEMDEVMTKTGNMETVVRVNQGRSNDSQATTTTSVKQRESSHEYD